MSVETPTGRFLGCWPHGSSEWLKARRCGLGGSEIAAVLGLSPYESAYSLWMRKRGMVGDIEATPAMEWGHYQEPALLAWYQDKHQPIQSNVGTFCHRDRSWAIANPDALADDRIVEAKSDHNPWAWGEPGTDAVPPYYRCQKLWYMDVLGYERTDLVATLNGDPPQVWTMGYDAADAAFLREKAKDFLDLVDSGIEPNIDGHEQTYRVVRQLHPQIKPGAEWFLDDETAGAYIDACRNEKTAAAEKRRTAAVILHQMGSAQHAMHGRIRIAQRQAKGDGLPYLVAARGS